MADGSVYVPVKRLTEFMIGALVKMGVPREDAIIVADVLLASDLYGVRSHGIAHLKMYYDRIKAGLQLPVTHWVFVHETPTTAVMDGGNGMGMVAGYHAMKTAIEKARANGLGAVAVRNSSHYGVAGYYTRMAADQGMLGMSLSNAHPSVAPTFGSEPLLGTNPIAISAPSDEAFAFTFDAATSVVPRGRLEVAARSGETIPPGWVIRKDGSFPAESSRLIEEIDRGNAALLPLGGGGEQMGGHKGYGLAAAVEIFSAAFQNGAFLSELHDSDKSGNPQPSRIGHFFLVINIDHFLPQKQFRETTGKILRELRESGKIPGEEKIYTPGEKAYRNEVRVARDGVEIPPAVQKSLQALCETLNVPGLDLES